MGVLVGCGGSGHDVEVVSCGLIGRRAVCNFLMVMGVRPSLRQFLTCSGGCLWSLASFHLCDSLVLFFAKFSNMFCHGLLVVLWSPSSLWLRVLVGRLFFFQNFFDSFLHGC